MMKTTASAVALACMLLAAQAAFYSNSWTVNQAIPDSNPVGWTDTRTVNYFGEGYTISDLRVTFTINNGHNGDLYAYLVHGDAMVVLLNRVGSGIPPVGRINRTEARWRRIPE
jgi:hypothetical protein